LKFIKFMNKRGHGHLKNQSIKANIIFLASAQNSGGVI